MIAWILLFILFPTAQSHTSNHALIVSSSRYWFNYRHAANALTIYKLLKDNGFHDDNIVLMVADEYAINPRNIFRNRILTSGRNGPSLYDADTQVDYRGDDVTVQNLVNVLTGRQETGLPVLQTDQNSNILIYWTGHGGDQFFKFQDVEEIMSQHLAAVFRHMHAAGRYQEILFVADTCQAFTLGDKLVGAPNITVIGSSLREESSYAHHSDYDVGLSVVERYTYGLDTGVRQNSTAQGEIYWHNTTIQQAMIDPFSYKTLVAHVGVRDDLAVRKVSQIPMADFFLNIEKSTTGRDTSKPGIVVDLPTSGFSFRNQAREKKDTALSNPLSVNSKDEPSLTGESLLKPRFMGMEPTEAPFLISLVLVIGLVTVAGLRW